MLTLKVLGGAAVHGPDGPLTGRIGQRRRLALLTVLALGGARATSRDRLIAFLWPESDAERARHSLADALYQLRRELGERAVVSRGDEVALDPELVDSDAGAFERAVARGDLPGAVALYGGPLLDGFHLPDAPEFERWVDGRRAELARSYAAALDRLATEAAARGDGSQAVEWARRLCALDPYNARATLRLMSALDAAGDRAGAIRQARVHAVMLEHELGAAPDAEIEALAERLRRGEPAEPATLGAEAAPPPVAAMGAESVPSPMLADAGAARDGVLPPRPRRARRWVAATPLAALAIVLVAVLAYAGRFVRAESREAIDGADLGPDGRAVVVLPCANLGGVASEEHFSDGLTDELTTLLARVHSLRVVARTSALGFKGSRLDVREIARRLDADVLVECGVRRAGERFRITAQLVNGADGMHLWADTYQGEGSDLIAIQSDLALRIVRALEARLTPRERTRLAHRSTAHPEAHALYLKGRHFWNQRTPASVERAIEYFTRAIAIDSQYAAAYAGLARAYSLQAVFGPADPRGAAERMRAAALRAIALDDGLAEAHAELGAYLNIYAWDSEASERSFQRALALDPDNASTRNLYSNLLLATGRIDETIAERRAALALDPLTPQMGVALGHALLAAGRREEALAAFRDAVELDTLFSGGWAGLGDHHALAGRHEDAVRAHRRAVALAPDHANARADLARVLADAGHASEARAIVAELRADGDRRGVHPPAVAFAMDALGDRDAAMRWLERSVGEKHPRLRLLRRVFEAPLAREARFLALLRRIGLPPPGELAGRGP